MDLGLSGKRALVTGGSHGIGRSVALLLAAEGCRVAVCARGSRNIELTLAELEALGVDCLGIEADVTKTEDIDSTLCTVLGRWGTLDILVNNVGGGGRWGRETPEDTPEEVWLEVYQKNALAAAKFTMGVIPAMRKQCWGRVVTITSILGREGGGRPWFNMAKCAQTALMKNLALRFDYARAGITFNSVAPGCIAIPDTGWDVEQQADPEQFSKFLDESFPLGRLGKPEEVANLVVFMCSERASYLTGASVALDGGESRAL